MLKSASENTQFLKLNFKLINVDCPDGAENSYTIENGLQNIYNGKKIIITWCDILPIKEINFNNFNDNIIFTYKNESKISKNYRC